MFPEVWERIAGPLGQCETATLTGYAAWRVRDEVFPGLTEADPGDVVAGILHRDVDEAALRRIDAFESSFYRRQSLAVKRCSGGMVSAEVYVVADDRRGVLENERWDPARFQAIHFEEFLRECERHPRPPSTDR